MQSAFGNTNQSEPDPIASLSGNAKCVVCMRYVMYLPKYGDVVYTGIISYAVLRSHSCAESTHSHSNLYKQEIDCVCVCEFLQKMFSKNDCWHGLV